MNNLKHQKSRGNKNQSSLLFKNASSKKIISSKELRVKLKKIFLDKAQNVFAIFSSPSGSEILNYRNCPLKNDSKIVSKMSEILIKRLRLRNRNKNTSVDPQSENAGLSGCFYGDKNVCVDNFKTDRKLVQTGTTISSSCVINRRFRRDSNDFTKNSIHKLKKEQDNVLSKSTLMPPDDFTKNSIHKLKKEQDNVLSKSIPMPPDQHKNELQFWNDLNGVESASPKQSPNLSLSKNISALLHQQCNELKFWDDLTGINVTSLRQSPSRRSHKPKSPKLFLNKNNSFAAPISSCLSESGSKFSLQSSEIPKSNQADSARVLRSTKLTDTKKLDHKDEKTCEKMKKDLIENMRFNFSVKYLNHNINKNETSLDQEASPIKEKNLLNCEKKLKTCDVQTFKDKNTFTVNSNNCLPSNNHPNGIKSALKSLEPLCSDQNLSRKEVGSSVQFQKYSCTQDQEPKLNHKYRNCKVLKKLEIKGSADASSKMKTTVLKVNSDNTRILRPRKYRATKENAENASDLIQSEKLSPIKEEVNSDNTRLLRPRKYRATKENAENSSDLIQNRKLSPIKEEVHFSATISEENLETITTVESKHVINTHSSSSATIRCESQENAPTYNLSQQSPQNNMNNQRKSQSKTLQTHLYDSCTTSASNNNFKRKLRLELEKLITDQAQIHRPAFCAAHRSEKRKYDPEHLLINNSRGDVAKKISDSQLNESHPNNHAKNDLVNTLMKKLKLTKDCADSKKLNICSEKMDVNFVTIDSNVHSVSSTNETVKKEPSDNIEVKKEEESFLPSSSSVLSHQQCSELTFWDDLTGVNITNLKPSPESKPSNLTANRNSNVSVLFNLLKTPTKHPSRLTEQEKTKQTDSARVLRSTKISGSHESQKLDSNTAKSFEVAKKELIENMRFNFSVKYLNNNMMVNKSNSSSPLSWSEEKNLLVHKKKLENCEVRFSKKNDSLTVNKINKSQFCSFQNQTESVKNSLDFLPLGSLKRQSEFHEFNRIQNVKSESSCRFENPVCVGMACDIEKNVSKATANNVRISRQKDRESEENLLNSPHIVQKSKIDSVKRRASFFSLIAEKVEEKNPDVAPQLIENTATNSSTDNYKTRERTSPGKLSSQKMINGFSENKSKLKHELSGFLLTSAPMENRGNKFEEWDCKFAGKKSDCIEHANFGENCQSGSYCSDLSFSEIHFSSSSGFCSEPLVKPSKVECKPCFIHVENITKKIDFCKQLELQFIYFPPKKKKLNQTGRTNLSFHNFPKKYRKLHKNRKEKL